jgi:hypothetical protein
VFFASQVIPASAAPELVDLTSSPDTTNPSSGAATGKGGASGSREGSSEGPENVAEVVAVAQAASAAHATRPMCSSGSDTAGSVLALDFRPAKRVSNGGVGGGALAGGQRRPAAESAAAAAAAAERCTICLEDVGSGDVLRVLPCTHRFHKVGFGMHMGSWDGTRLAQALQYSMRMK